MAGVTGIVYFEHEARDVGKAEIGIEIDRVEWSV